VKLMGRAFGIVALIFGIISIPVGGIISPLAQFLASLGGLFGNPQFGIIISILGWVCIVVAILFGIIGIIVEESKGMGIAGLVLGIVSLILRFTIGFLYTLILSFIP
jgi:hypothetical protein